MKIEVIIETLAGNKKSIRNYAYTIAEMSESSTNAYVMALDAENAILWTVQAGDGVETAEDVITWDGVKRVEIYDHSADMSSENATKTEFVYITTAASLAQYLNERSAADYEVIYNTTGQAARFAEADADQADTDQDNTDQDDTNNRAQVSDGIKSAAQCVGHQVAQVARALAHAAALLVAYLIQTAATTARAAYRLARVAWRWLNTRHDFDPCNEEPVIMTGWQYIGLGLLASVILLVLSIDVQ